MPDTPTNESLPVGSGSGSASSGGSDSASNGGNGGSSGGGDRSPPAAAGRPEAQTSVLSLAQLIGAPIHALVDAEAQSAMATARFIRSVGFTGDGEGGELGELQMARFRRRRRSATGANEDVEVEIPLLSMLPIPALQIRDAELDYTVRIIQTEAQHSRNAASRSSFENTPNGEPLATLRASFAREARASDRRTVDMLVKMKVRIEQADMPGGLAQLLALASESTGQTVVPADDE